MYADFIIDDNYNNNSNYWKNILYFSKLKSIPPQMFLSSLPALEAKQNKNPV
jgi:hypothetical protein